MNFFENNFRIIVLLALIAGLAIGWIDTRPHWDDTGVTVALIFFSSFLLGLPSYRNAWIPALIISLCIISLNFLITNRFDSAVSLLISSAGAYAGVLFKYFLTK